MENFKVIYKILKQLENHMGDENFSVYCISAEKMKISFEKWEQLMILMQNEGYISGLAIANDLSSNFSHIAEPIKPIITIKGMEYLVENSLMAKAKEALKMVGEIL